MLYSLRNIETNEILNIKNFDGAPPELSPAKKLVWDVYVQPAPSLISLEDLKSSKNQEINSSRFEANLSSFTYAGKQVACDALSRSDIDAVNGIVSLINNMPPNWVGGWKAMDNTILPIPDVATWINFYSAMVQQGTANFVKAQTLKAQLETAYANSNREAMEAIKW